MRATFLAVVMMAGCDGGSGGAESKGYPHETCVEADGFAPCCDIPAVEDLTCDDGAEVRLGSDGDDPDLSGYCSAPGPELTSAGDRVGVYRWDLFQTFPDHPDGQEEQDVYAAWSLGETWQACGKSGRLAQWRRNFEDGTACMIGCWDHDGRPLPGCNDGERLGWCPDALTAP